jgi:hypothetical protein
VEAAAQPGSKAAAFPRPLCVSYKFLLLLQREAGAAGAAAVARSHLQCL